jgi:hypothetical protein
VKKYGRRRNLGYALHLRVLPGVLPMLLGLV